MSRRRPGRPRFPDARRRDHFVTVRFNDFEFAPFMRAVTRSGASKPCVWARTMLVALARASA